MQKKFILTLVFVLPILLMFALILRSGKSRASRENEGQPVTDSFLQKVVDVWNTNEIVSIESVDLKNIFDHQQAAKLATLPQNRIRKLEEKFSEFLVVYSQTNCLPYLKFKAGERTEIDQEFKKFVFRKAMLIGETISDNSSELDYACHVWKLLNGTNKITHISPSSIELILITTKSDDRIQFLSLAKNDTDNVEMSISSFACPLKVHPTISDVINAEGQADCVHISFFVQFNEVAVNVPIHIVFYWSEKMSCWMPLSMFGKLLMNYNTVF